jgi:hypothetical protein
MGGKRKGMRTSGVDSVFWVAITHDMLMLRNGSVTVSEVMEESVLINIYHLDLILHLQGQASQYQVP